jgi:acyl-CoA thioester hydrolase
MKSSSVVFECRIEREPDRKPIASGWTRHAFVDRKGKILRGDNPLRRWIETLGE